MKQEEKNILKQINAKLTKIMVFIESNSLSKESERLFQKSENRVEYSLQQIQNSFNRIHDKLFRLNNILIGLYIVLSTYPADNLKLKLWTVIFPLMNLIYFIWIEYRQLGIHRFASNQLHWSEKEREQYGKKIGSQNLYSLLSILFTAGIILFLIFKLK